LLLIWEARTFAPQSLAAIERLGIGLASLVNLLNPAIIVIGGGLSNGWELFEQHMRHQLIERAFPIPARTVKTTRVEFGDDAGILGAAWLAFEGQQPSVQG
jgi:glucokinase